MPPIEQFLVPAPQGPSARRAMLDGDAAERFLRSQCSWLQKGLHQACDPPEVTRVLSAHDTCHHSWLGLIAAVNEALGDVPARILATLYAFHGRVAGSLERGPDPLLSEEVCADVRALLECRLTTLTDGAVDALRRSTESCGGEAPNHAIGTHS